MDFSMEMELSLEQQFNLAVYEEQVKSLSPKESKDFLLEVMRQLMVKDNLLRYFMKQQLLNNGVV